MPTIVEIIKKSEQFLREHGVTTPRLDTELLIGDVLQLDRIALYMKFDLPLSQSELSKIRTFIKRRSQREPVAYILGKKEFYATSFFVQPGVLCPRPDTETLIEHALSHIPKDDDFFIADVGSGTGCIGLTLALERPNLKVYATDISPEALQCTKQNVTALELSNRVAVLKGLYLDPIPPERPINMIVSNPPYIPSDVIDELAPEVRAHEPRLALDGGPDGLSCYRALAVQASSRMVPLIALEIGFDQSQSVAAIFQQKDYNVECFQDISGNDRVLICRRTS